MHPFINLVRLKRHSGFLFDLVSTEIFIYYVDIYNYVVYTEIQKKGKKEYYYLVHTIRLDRGYKKIRVFLGSDLRKEKLQELIDKKKPLIDFKIKLYQDTKKESFELKIDFSKDILSKKQIESINNLKKSYQQKIKLSDKDILKKVRESFLIKFTYNTNSAEGNTISLKETELILKKGIVPKSHSLREVHEIENTIKAYEFIENYSGELDNKFILGLHELVTKNTLENPKNEGKYRKKGQNVAMIGSKYFPPKGGRNIKKLVTNIINEYNNSKLSLFEKIVLFHSAFILIHPFIDGNGRVSRLIFNWMLIKNKFPPLDFPSSEHIEFTDLMEESRNGDSVPLANFLYLRMMDTYMGTK